MKDFVKGSNCGYECEIEKMTCPSCGEILPFVEECSSCGIDLPDAGTIRSMFGDE